MPPKDKNHLYQQLKKFKINQIDLGFRKFDIFLVEDLQLPNGDKLDGFTNFGEYRLELDADLSDDRARETMTHEVFHCILDLMEVDERTSNKLVTTNEILTCLLTRGYLLFKRLNPKLCELLF